MSSQAIPLSSVRLVFIVALVVYLAAITDANIHNYTFNLAETNVTRLCKNYTIVTVNGQLPGPTLHVRDGDTVIVKVHNKANYNATIHWHGVKQFRTGWSDGPVYITQCPILPGKSFTYRFNVTGQEGTVWWHAHVSWLRATVYGALIIYPKRGIPYPFDSQPIAEFPIVIGEWWNSNPIAVIDEAVLTGGGPNLSNAFTINGQPGDLYNCSSPETIRVTVNQGETYLLRIVNAAMQNAFFFKIASHRFTVVAVDASYTKPYETDVVVISPGQTTDVLFTANQTVGRYYMAARPYSNLGDGGFDNTTTTAILEYAGDDTSTTPKLPSLPYYNDTDTVTKFSKALRSLASLEHPVDVPQTPNVPILSTVGLGLLPCGPGNTTACAGPFEMRLSASMNNISFVEPRIALLQAYYYNIPDVFTEDFPSEPPTKFDYTSLNNSNNSLIWTPERATKVMVLEYNSTVQMVFQGTSIIGIENHPMHLHGYNFYVVGQGFGNYDNHTDPTNFNLVDPPERNTVIAPTGGWVAIRFRANNPGMWFLHCHLDDHLTWGLDMAFLVKNGAGPLESLEPPPDDLPVCLI